MKKTLLSLMMVPLLSACGGGGGGGEAPVGPLSVTVSEVPSVLNENGTVTISYTATNVKDGINASFVSNNPAVTLTPSGTSAYTLNAAELDRDATAALTLSIRDGNDTTRVVNRTYNIKVINSSFANTLAEIEQIMPLESRLVEMAEETKMVAVLDDVAKLVQELSISVASSEDFVSTETAESLSAAFDKVNLAAYKNGSISDTTLSDQYDELILALANHINATKEVLNSRFSAASALLPSSVQANEFVIDRARGVASFFIGNPTYGAYVDGNWVFNEQYAFIGGLTQDDCTL